MSSEQPSSRTVGPEDSGTDVTTVTFTYQGVAYTVDLAPADAAAFDSALAPFISAARRVGGIRSSCPE